MISNIYTISRLTNLNQSGVPLVTTPTGKRYVAVISWVKSLKVNMIGYPYVFLVSCVLESQKPLQTSIVIELGLI